jgi:hypothetical protein
MTRVQSAVAGILVAMAFCAMTMIHLEAQGAYYDELHQAPAAFSYLGKHPKFFTVVFFDYPSLNMSYSGAIKSAIYGLFLRFVHPHFTLYSWRFLGIALVAAGIFIFYWIVGSSLTTGSAALFAVLLLTDVSVIVMTRHDWGPVALALLLRLAFVAAWLSIEFEESTAYKYGIIGLITGVAIFEKLSSLVLIVPFSLLIFRSRTRRTAWIPCGVGLLVGAIPLIRANMHTYRTTGTLVSFWGVAEGKGGFSVADVFGYARQYLSLGQGDIAQQVVLGESVNSFFTTMEAILIGLILLGITVAAFHLPRHPMLRLASVMTASYVLIALALLVLPLPTYVHHWIIGTPFQYCAMALAAPAIVAMARQKIPFAGTYRWIFAVTICALIAMRLPTLAAVESSLASGKAAPGFDPAFNQLAEFAATRSENSFFMATDWGTGTQLLCGVNGEDNTVDEPYWSETPVQTALELAHKTTKPVLYVIRSGIDQRWAEVSADILTGIKNSKEWTESPLDDTTVNPSRIEIHKFHRASPHPN